MLKIPRSLEKSNLFLPENFRTKAPVKRSAHLRVSNRLPSKITVGLNNIGSINYGGFDTNLSKRFRELWGHWS